MHIIAGKAVCFGEALKPDIKEYQQKVLDNCKALANGFTKYGVDLVSGGDNHLLLLGLALASHQRVKSLSTDLTGFVTPAECHPQRPRKAVLATPAGLQSRNSGSHHTRDQTTDMEKIAEYISLRHRF